MKSFKFARISAVAAAAVLSCSFASADTLNMAVSAQVVGTCKLVSVPAMDFGTLNQVTAPVVPAAANVTYRCTKNTAPATFTVGGGGSPYTGSLGNGTDNIAYTVSWTAPTTGGDGLGTTITPVTVALTGSMAGGTNYQNASAGTYTQSVAVVITP